MKLWLYVAFGTGSFYFCFSASGWSMWKGLWGMIGICLMNTIALITPWSKEIRWK